MMSVDITGLFEGDLRRLTKIIRAAISFFGVLLLAIIAFAGWSANKTATDSERTLVENALNQAIGSVLDGQKSVAWWDDAVTNTADGALNQEFADAEFGLFLGETYGHDEIYILDGTDTPIYAYKEGARAEPSVYAAREATFAPLVAEIRNGVETLRDRPDDFGRAQTNYRVLAGVLETARWAGHIVSLDGMPAVVAAITIVPNVDMTLLKGTPKLLVSVVRIDEAFIKKIAQSLLLPDLELAARDAARDRGGPARGHRARGAAARLSAHRILSNRRNRQCRSAAALAPSSEGRDPALDVHSDCRDLRAYAGAWDVDARAGDQGFAGMA